jgi:hypothetical protein
MGIRHIPNDIDTFERFNLDYEDTHFQYSDANRCIATATRDLFLGWFLPKPLRGLESRLCMRSWMIHCWRRLAFQNPHQACGVS